MQPEIMPTTVQEEKKKKSVLFYINIFLFLAVLGLGAYILVKEGFWIKKQNHEMKETEEATEKKKSDGSIVVEVKESKYVDFEGDYIKAKLPEGWSIKEYKDGEGSDYLVDGSNPKGLTGLEIKKGDLIVLKFQAIDGYGSNSCPEIAHFKDFSKKYEDDLRAQNNEMGDETTILDYTDTSYPEIMLFGLKTRRIGDIIYYDVVAGDTYFEPQCLKQILVFEDLKFTVTTDSLQTHNGNYQYLISKSTDENTYESLDGILQSMEVK